MLTLRYKQNSGSLYLSVPFCPHEVCIDMSHTHICCLQELATNIFSTSIFPYSAFLYFLTKSKKTPPLALFGFYFLLVFVFATIPAGVIGERLAMLPLLSAVHVIKSSSDVLLCCSSQGISQEPCKCGLLAWQCRIHADSHKLVHW